MVEQDRKATASGYLGSLGAKLSGLVGRSDESKYTSIARDVYAAAGASPPKNLKARTEQDALGHLGLAIQGVWKAGTANGMKDPELYRKSSQLVGAYAKGVGQDLRPAEVHAMVTTVVKSMPEYRKGEEALKEREKLKAQLREELKREGHASTA